MRGSISAELDGELSEFESIRLRGHLNRCDSCTAFKADAERFAMALRVAPLEPLSKPIAVPSRRRSVLPLRVPAVSAAAVAVLMIASGGLFETLHSGLLINPSHPAGTAVDDQSFRALQQQSTRQALAVQFVRRAQFQASLIPRHPGFQNP